MQFVMIFSLILAVLSVMFAMQNTAVVTLHFMFWTFESPLALLLIIAITIGAIITSILTFPGWFRTKRTSAKHRKEMDGLEENLAKYRTDLIDTQNKNKDLRQKILEVEEAKENLERAKIKADEEINDMRNALEQANLTKEEAEQAQREAIAARDSINEALQKMEVRLASGEYTATLLTEEAEAPTNSIEEESAESSPNLDQEEPVDEMEKSKKKSWW